MYIYSLFHIHVLHIIHTVNKYRLLTFLLDEIRPDNPLSSADRGFLPVTAPYSFIIVTLKSYFKCFSMEIRRDDDAIVDRTCVSPPVLRRLHTQRHAVCRSVGGQTWPSVFSLPIHGANTMCKNVNNDPYVLDTCLSMPSKCTHNNLHIIYLIYTLLLLL